MTLSKAVASLLLALSYFAAGAPAVASAQERLFDDQGYRVAWMRSPTPLSVHGASTLSLEELLVKLDQPTAPLLVDVLPLTWMGIWVETEPHQSLPGAVWLPNIGRAELEPQWQEYMEYHLERLLKGDKARELVVFCRADCWYSWNAVRRLADQGYSSLYWYRLGTDGWSESGRVLFDIDPQPVKSRLQEQ